MARIARMGPSEVIDTRLMMSVIDGCRLQGAGCRLQVTGCGTLTRTRKSEPELADRRGSAYKEASNGT